jgi:hypothetical protein
MRLNLTPIIHTFLTAHGYQYCLSRTQSFQTSHDDPEVTIVLFPVKEKPKLENLPEEYDTFFNLSKEPAMMAGGIGDTEVLVELTDDDFGALQKYLNGLSIRK